MNIQSVGTWPTTVEEAIAVQKMLHTQVITRDDLPEPVRYVAGVDVGFEKEGTVTRAAVVVLSFPDLKPVEDVLTRRPTSFPYVPGLLSFREMPALLDALAQLRITPDLILCDGQGIAHPRRFGIACHIGVVTGLPTLGVGKSILVGKHEEVEQEKGSWKPMLYKGEVVGAALRTRSKFNPLYISPGHRISLSTAIQYVMACTTKYRLPETTRYAHDLASNQKDR